MSDYRRLCNHINSVGLAALAYLNAPQLKTFFVCNHSPYCALLKFALLTFHLWWRFIFPMAIKPVCELKRWIRGRIGTLENLLGRHSLFGFSVHCPFRSKEKKRFNHFHTSNWGYHWSTFIPQRRDEGGERRRYYTKTEGGRVPIFLFGVGDGG